MATLAMTAKEPTIHLMRLLFRTVHNICAPENIESRAKSISGRWGVNFAECRFRVSLLIGPVRPQVGVSLSLSPIFRSRLSELKTLPHRIKCTDR